ncbi:MAG: bactofilin family protein, partial [Vicinamibacterales bacterium]
MVISKALTIKGDLSAAEDLTIDFIFEGSIEAPGRRVEFPHGSRVQATVVAASVSIDGELEGHIAADRVDLASTAVVSGSIISQTFLIEEGAVFNGPVNTERARA